MANKVKSWIMLFVFSLSLVPFGMGQAETPDRTFEEARYLLYLGDAFLEEEANLDSAVYFPGLMAPVPGVQGAEGAEEVMSRMIHAAKQERNDLDANCRQLQNRYRTAGDQEAVRKLKAYCDSERQRLSNRIGFLHKLRGDRRKLFTRWWHSIKRGSENFWRRIGPIGRNILRRVGDEAYNTVIQGGNLGGGVAREILKRALASTGKDMLKDAAKRMVLQGMQKLVQGQVQIAREAGIIEEGETAENDGDSLLESQEESDVAESQHSADNSNDEQSSCQPGKPWLAAAWEETVVPRLKEDGKHCFSSREYYSCLQEQEAAGVCPLDGFAACEDVYQELLPSGGGMVKITDHSVFFRDNDNYFEISFPVQGGAVSGYTAVNYEEDKGSGDICSVSITYTFSGSFNPSNCQLQGSGTKTLNWGENRPFVCVGYPEPYDDAAENWSMILKNGNFHITRAPSGFPHLNDYDFSDYLH